MKRVVILGPGASGKSTLAARLSAITGLSVIQLDKVFWRPGLVPTPRDQWVKIQQMLVEEDGWIMDGIWDPMTLSRSGFVLRTQSFSWTSRSCDALGEQFGDRASVPISGFRCCGIAAKAVRFSWKRSLTTQLTRPSTCYVTLRHSGDSSQTKFQSTGRDSLVRAMDEEASAHVGH
jgi:hypothetical protein